LEDKKNTLIERLIEDIEKEYNLSYTSPFFSRAAYFYLKNGFHFKNNKVTPDELKKFLDDLVIKNKNKVLPQFMRMGHIYHFGYVSDDKKIPYYDMTPCIIYIGTPQKKKNTYFYGLNLNYLHPSFRYEFLKKHPFFVSKKNIFSFLEENEKTFKDPSWLKNYNINFNYDMAKGIYINEYKYVIKKYNYRNLIKNPVRIDFSTAKLITLFEIDNFMKKNKFFVWRDVIKSIIERE